MHLHHRTNTNAAFAASSSSRRAFCHHRRFWRQGQEALTLHYTFVEGWTILSWLVYSAWEWMASPYGHTEFVVSRCERGRSWVDVDHQRRDATQASSWNRSPCHRITKVRSLFFDEKSTGMIKLILGFIVTHTYSENLLRVFRWKANSLRAFCDGNKPCAR